MPAKKKQLKVKDLTGKKVAEAKSSKVKGGAPKVICKTTRAMGMK